MTEFQWFAIQTTDHNGRWFTDYECLGIADALLYQRDIEYRDGIPCRIVQIDRAGNRIA